MPSPRPALAIGTRLAGLLTLDATQLHDWPIARTWRYPVGDPADLDHAVADHPPYQVNRGLEPRAESGRPHQGVDLCNRQAGGEVVAAAAGLVVAASDDTSSAYGVTAVVSHRLAGGGLAYSVYAHLEPRSLALRPGQVVTAGAKVGRVGRTGRASTDHLHFEIRIARDPGLRWEKTPAVNPLAFIAARLVPVDRDSASARSVSADR